MPVCERTSCTCARAICPLPRKGSFDMMWPVWAYLQPLITAPWSLCSSPPDLGHRRTGAIPLHGVYILQRLWWLRPGFWCHWRGDLWSPGNLEGWCSSQNHSNGAVLPHGGAGEQDRSGRPAGTADSFIHSFTKHVRTGYMPGTELSPTHTELNQA